MIPTFSLKVVGKEDDVVKFKDFLKDNKINITIGIRSSSNDNNVSLHLVIKTYLDIFPNIFYNWFKLNGDIITITGDKNSVDMPDMNEIIFSDNDSVSIIKNKLEDLADRQKHYESNINRSLKSWKSKGVI